MWHQFLSLDRVRILTVWKGQRALGMHQKCLNLCSEDERKSYRFGTTWGWVINDRIFSFVWTVPFRTGTEVQTTACIWFQNTRWPDQDPPFTFSQELPAVSTLPLFGWRAVCALWGQVSPFWVVKRMFCITLADLRSDSFLFSFHSRL